jgi:hypothetical protein
MAILDGEFIDDKDIDPVKHKFIGTFREPFSAYENMAGEHHCRCGEHLFNNKSLLDHWQQGHMDAAQYVSIGKGSIEKGMEGAAYMPIITKRHQCRYCVGKDRHIAVCEENPDGTFFLKSGNMSTHINYCPFCGKKAPKQIGD